MKSNAKNIVTEKALTFDGAIFILCMVFALNPNIAGYKVPTVVPYCLYALWVFLAICKVSSARTVVDTGLKPLGARLAAPKIAMILYTAILVVTGVSDYGVVGGLNQLASFAIPIAAIYLFGATAIDLIFYACVFSAALLIPFTVALYGPSCIVAPFLSVMDSTVSNPFETNQFTFTATYLCVFYCFLDKRKITSRVVLSLIMCFIGFKRIAVLALLVAALFKYISKNMTPRSRFAIYRGVLLCLGVGCFAFIFLLYSGFIKDLMSLFSVNVMGRNYYWQAAVDNSVFSITYLGQGVNTLQELLTTNYSYLRVGGVHCDILKMYFELGFVGFILWLYYYLVYMPRWIARSGAVLTFEAYAIVTLLQFVLFFTDNVDIYLGSQILFCTIPMALWVTEVDSVPAEKGCPEHSTVNKSFSTLLNRR